jgi:hypothetical protein
MIFIKCLRAKAAKHNNVVFFCKDKPQPGTMKGLAVDQQLSGFPSTPHT